MLREIVTGSMAQLEAVIKEAERADSKAQSFNAIGMAPRCLHPCNKLLLTRN